MARQQRRPQGPPEDLERYEGCRADALIGLEPLAAGWLQRGRPFPQGRVPDDFPEALLDYCLPPHIVCGPALVQACPICGQRITEPLKGDTDILLGNGEIRVIGEADVFAAPALIYHYVVAHQYLPPAQFIDAVLTGPPAGSAEHRALIRALQTVT